MSIFQLDQNLTGQTRPDAISQTDVTEENVADEDYDIRQLISESGIN